MVPMVPPILRALSLPSYEDTSPVLCTLGLTQTADTGLRLLHAGGSVRGVGALRLAPGYLRAIMVQA